MTHVEYPGLQDSAPMLASVAELSAVDTSIRMRPPLLGEHTDQILARLDYSSAQIKALRENRVV